MEKNVIFRQGNFLKFQETRRHLHRRKERNVMFGMGPQEILIILVVALIFIGPRKLPEIARSLGKGFGELKRALDDVKGQVDLETMMKDPEEQEQRDEPPDRDTNTLLQETFLGSGVTQASSDAEESISSDEQEKEEVPEKTEE
jgi:Tat protein translocase TatB subunit